MKKTVLILILLFPFIAINSSFAQWIPDMQWSGLGTFQFDSVGSDIYCAVYNIGILRSTNSGVNWTNISGSQTPGTAFNVVHNSTYLFAGLYFNGVYRTSNNGVNWTVVNNGFPAQNRDIRAMVVKGQTVFAGSSYQSSYIYKTTNNGDSWFVPDTASHFSAIRCMASQGQYVFVTAMGGLYRTSNDGLNWVHMSSELDTGFTTSLVVSGSKIYASGTYGSNSGGIYVSSDFGSSWIKILNQITCVFAYNNMVFGGNQTNFYVSTNYGVNWINKNEGIYTGVYSIFACNNIAYIGTGLGGPGGIPVLYHRSINNILKINMISTVVPEKNELNQNYPNPFNPATIIKFQIKDLRFVSLKVYDILGKEVATLVNEKQLPGVYEITWDASQYPSGIYFYRLETNNYSETKKMLLIK